MNAAEGAGKKNYPKMGVCLPLIIDVIAAGINNLKWYQVM